MILSELLQKLSQLDANLEVIVRGEDTIAEILDVYEDSDHTDDSRFISIDLENKTEQVSGFDRAKACPECGSKELMKYCFCKCGWKS